MDDNEVLFSTRQGRRMSADTVQYFVAKYAAIARECSPHYSASG
jgi:integrase/recombinase XerD